MSFRFLTIIEPLADTSPFFRQIDRLGEKASTLDKGHEVKRFLAAELLAEIINDLEKNLSWYIKLFTVRAVSSDLTYGVDIGFHQGVDCGDHAWCGSSNEGRPSCWG